MLTFQGQSQIKQCP